MQRLLVMILPNAAGENTATTPPAKPEAPAPQEKPPIVVRSVSYRTAPFIENYQQPNGIPLTTFGSNVPETFPDDLSENQTPMRQEIPAIIDYFDPDGM